MALLQHPLAKVLVALAIGLLVGTERERRKRERHDVAGVRTYGLAGLLGGACSIVGIPWLVVVGGLFVSAVAIAAYVRTPKDDPGTTTEVALLVTYVLGVLAVTQPGVASGAAIVMTAVLALRARMHSWVREALSQGELEDALLLGIAALVVLPLLPDRSIGPFGGVHPPTLWRLVVLMMALSGAGYVAQRIVGPRFGLPLAGLAGGFVSSSATIAAMGARAKEEPELARSAAAAAACSTIATVVELAIVVGAANHSVLAAAAVPLSVAGATAALYGVVMSLRGTKASRGAAPKGRAFQIRSALAFAALVGIVTLLARAASLHFGRTGLLVTVGLAALADAHSAAASAAAAAPSPGAGVLGVLLALSANSVTKLVMAFSAGPRTFALRVGAGVILVAVAAWAAYTLA